jgi:RHS repeat-associated protein
VVSKQNLRVRIFAKNPLRKNYHLRNNPQAGISDIAWTADGKVRKIIKSGNDIEFVYDASGNRTMKIEKGLNYMGAIYTYYIHDAAGNVLATYSRTIDADHILSTGTYSYMMDDLYLTEKTVYGASRLGVKNENRKLSHHEFKIDDAYTGFYPTIMDDLTTTDYPENFEKEKRRVGEKVYELSNHLNNILEVVTDRKIGNTGETAYEADIIMYSDYYPFGMVMPGRNGSTDQYRYGFQGQEIDDEIKGDNNSVNYKYRMHDPRIGRFFATDPMEAAFPYNSPYAFS